MRFTRASHHSSPKMVEPHGDSGELAIGAGKSRRVVISTLSLEKTDAGRELAKGEITMKMTLASVVALSLVAGCASTQTVMNKPVTGVYHSDKSQKEVAFCLGNKNNVAVLDKDDGSKVVLLKNGYGGVSMVFTVFADGTGSRTEYRLQFGTIGGAWKQCVGTLG